MTSPLHPITIGRTTRRGLSSPLPGQVYVGRPSPLGNPFQIGRDGTREEVIALYRTWLWEKIRWPAGSPYQRSLQRAELLRLLALARQGPLELLCWCAPLSCHADVIRAALIWLADQQEPCMNRSQSDLADLEAAHRIHKRNRELLADLGIVLEWEPCGNDPAPPSPTRPRPLL